MPNELHLSLFPGLNFVRDEQGHWHTETDENAPIDDPTLKAVASRLPAAPHQPGFSDLFTAAAKSVLPLFRARPSVTSSLFANLTSESVKDDTPVEGPDHEAHLLNLFRQSDDLRLLGLQEASHELLREVSIYVGNIDPLERPKFEVYSLIARAQSHLAGGDLDTARSVLRDGNPEDPRIATFLSAVERSYAVRQSERIIQVVSAAAIVAQKRVGGFDNWANDGRPRARIMEGLQGWAREYRSLVENGMPALEAFERTKYWVMDLDHVGHVMNEEGLWNVVGEIGAMDVPNVNRPDERMNAILLHMGDRLRDRHEGEAASHVYGILENAVSYRESARERLQTLDGDLREGEIRRFLRGLTPWTAERPEDFYGTLITVGTMAITGGVGAAAGRMVAAEAGSALLGRVAAIGFQSFTQPGLNASANGIYNDGLSGLMRGLDPVADGTYMTQVEHNAVLMGGLGAGHFAATRLGGGLLMNLGISVAGMTTFDLITDPRNREVSAGLLIANSLGNDLIGRASGVAQRGVEAAPGLAWRGARALANAPTSVKILAAASLALQGCDAQTALDMIPALGMTSFFGGLALMAYSRFVGIPRGMRSERENGLGAPRGVDPAIPFTADAPLDPEGTNPGAVNPELIWSRARHAVNNFLIRFASFSVKTHAALRNREHPFPDLPLSVSIGHNRGGPSELEIMAGRARHAGEPLTQEVLLNSVLDRARQWAEEYGLVFTSAPNGGRSFTVRDADGNALVNGNVRFGFLPERGPSVEVRTVGPETDPFTDEPTVPNLIVGENASPSPMLEVDPFTGDTDPDIIVRGVPTPDQPGMLNSLGEARPPENPGDDFYTNPDLAVPTETTGAPVPHGPGITTLLGVAMVLGGCDATHAPTAVGVVAALGALIVAGRRFFAPSNLLEAPRSANSAEPAVQSEETPPPSTADALTSMTSRWRDLSTRGLSRDNFAAANRDAEELGRMAGRMFQAGDAEQSAYMELVANLWATGNETLRAHLNPILENAGTTLRPNIIRSLTLRVLRSPSSLRAAANLVSFLPRNDRADILERFVELPGGLATLMNAPRGTLLAADHVVLANAASRSLLEGNNVSLPMIRNLAAGISFEALSPLSRIVLNPRFNLESMATASERRSFLLGLLGGNQISDFEKAVIEEALLPRAIR